MDVDYKRIARELAREPRTIAELFEKYGLVYCGEPILLDVTVAELFGVRTRDLSRAVQRNLFKFQADFVARATPLQFHDLRSKFGTSNAGRGGTRHLPYVFTKEGVASVSTILSTPQAIDLSIQLARLAGRSSNFWKRVRLKDEIDPPRL